jgi:hypothetical protein
MTQVTSELKLRPPKEGTETAKTRTKSGGLPFEAPFGDLRASRVKTRRLQSFPAVAPAIVPRARAELGGGVALHSPLAVEADDRLDELRSPWLGAVNRLELDHGEAGDSLEIAEV